MYIGYFRHSVVKQRLLSFGWVMTVFKGLDHDFSNGISTCDTVGAGGV
jgi:hypothetical protein